MSRKSEDEAYDQGQVDAQEEIAEYLKSVCRVETGEGIIHPKVVELIREGAWRGTPSKGKPRRSGTARVVLEELSHETGGWIPFVLGSFLKEKDGEYTITVRVRAVKKRKRVKSSVVGVDQDDLQEQKRAALQAFATRKS